MHELPGIIRHFSLPAFLLLFLGGCTTFPELGSGGRNAPDQLDKPYLVLISIAGFRWDYPDLYTTPEMEEMRGIFMASETGFQPCSKYLIIRSVCADNQYRNRADEGAKTSFSIDAGMLAGYLALSVNLRRKQTPWTPQITNCTSAVKMSGKPPPHG